ncbi:hypothetical protein [Paraglaciecola sp. 20A4]|uniref:hypothetical protein n=1 Tax=Paraglaciecola sp. 20A4 TaxID=2687288 RepID=UPI003211D4CD
MKQNNIIPNVRFRFLNLDKMQAFTLSREVEGASYRELAVAGRYEGSVDLKEQRLDALNIFFVRQQIAIDECDIFVSANLPYQDSVVVTPSIVNRLLKHIDCQLTFSIVDCD